jgi:epsilon-lactone hydrolase
MTQGGRRMTLFALACAAICRPVAATPPTVATPPAVAAPPAAATQPATATQPDEYEDLFQMPLKPPETSVWTSAVRRVVAAARERERRLTGVVDRCPPIERADRAHGPAIRECQADAYQASRSYRELQRRYPVHVDRQVLGGVSAEVFTPADGIAPQNRHRVLMSLHGGSFIYGARTESRSASIPIASVARVEVIGIDYREAPEYAFPAASEDVIAVYRELLKSHAPQEIGLYGCAAGALLAAEATAWLVKHKIPPPGALGLFCEGAGYWEGAGRPMHSADDFIWRAPAENPYFIHASSADPLAFPIRSTAVLANFPPTLLLTASRDPALGAAVDLQAALVRLGVHAELHVFEGLERKFFFDPASPAAPDVYTAAARFFDSQLGR